MKIVKLFFICVLSSIVVNSTQYQSQETKRNNDSVALSKVSDSDSLSDVHHHVSKRFAPFVFFGASLTIGAISALFTCIFICTGKHPVIHNPNQPPTFTSCNGPGNEEYFADWGTHSTVVTWNTPTANDPEEGQLQVQVEGGTPGMTFERGFHRIIYTAADSTGATANCQFTFRISVITCDPIKWPANGKVYCNDTEHIYGSNCTVECAEGYEIDSLSTSYRYQIMCNKSSSNQGEWHKEVPQCKVISCPLNATELDVENGSPDCSNNEYKSSCMTQCDSGYGLSSGIKYSTCQQNKTWSLHLPNCEDNQPPEIRNCPQTVTVYTDKLSQTTVVNWTQPTATDNSDEVTVYQTKGGPPGSSFPVGQTEVRYQASDANNNTSPECTFFINVEEIRCDPPFFTDKYINYDCPDGYAYGSACKIKCMGSFPLIGNDTITCERNDSGFPPRGQWNIGEFQPYCLKNPCDQLPAPENGAMVCEKWFFGLKCQMQCSDNFDIPLGTVGSDGGPFTGQFTCSESKGEYGPSNTVPGCTQLRRPLMTTALGELFYYTGDCNDPSVLMEIKENFILHMQYLQSVGWDGVCPSEIDCNVNNTLVTCGAISGKKRDVNFVLGQLRSKRSTHEIRVEVTLATTWYQFNSSASSTFYFLEEVQRKMFSVMTSLATNGNLTVRGLNPDANSFSLGYSVPDCPTGHALRHSTLTCVPCSAGTFLDPMKSSCTDCPVGTYKEIPENVDCTPCPSGKSTETTGSRNITSCLRKCSPGEFSKTGLEPCKLCSKSSYQTDEMSTSCLQCPFGKTTTFPGATNQQICSNFDIGFSEANQNIEFDPPTSNQSKLAVSVWLFVPNTLANFSIFNSESSNSRINIYFLDTLDIRINSQLLTTSVVVPRNTWFHVTIQIDSDNQTVKVYVNGSKVYSDSINNSVFNSSLISETSAMSIMLNEASSEGYLISGYHVDFSSLSDSEVADLASTCHVFQQNAHVSMDTFINMARIQDTFTSPSICDSINQCQPNPCNGHPCVDMVNAYKCQCQDGYTGEMCQNPPDYCRDNPCENNGTCSNLGRKFICSCPTGYKGNQCQVQIVNGEWSPWTSFSECSASCAGGIKTRSRQCNSPAPDPDGRPCDANGANETIVCNTEDCPTCPQLRKGFANLANCTKNSDGHEVCAITCRAGYIFTAQNQPLPAYVCGPNTSFTWNGRPPSCGRANSPRSISVVSSVQYFPEIPCIEASTASSILKSNLGSSLSCAVNGSCSIDVTTTGCSGLGRRRRSTSTSQITLTQTFISGDNLNLEDFQDSQNASKPLTDLVEGISSLELSAQQINSTHSILQFEINGVLYTSTAVSTDSVVQCPTGQGRSGVLCVDCPLGTFSDSGTCNMCSIGTYQDESGQSSCKPCSIGFTTKYKGSQNITDCIAIASSTTQEVTTQLADSNFLSKKDEAEDENNVWFIVIVVLAILAIIGAVTVASICLCKQLKRSRFRRLDPTNTIRQASWASLSMIKPALSSAEVTNTRPDKVKKSCITPGSWIIKDFRLKSKV
uniref:Sushi, von Willebrand factor type A, EGF and pentraxin domain-containing protein 1-like isoform X3 n=1 Tax=Crassostrea virginica TaxID=6565 RepID=A0A8B8BYH3_CRAVI|nr:sushi, von Willebrand factor type A, EGF and pentraxin domain-containing protein 1-like isoform X3 [Crassostrea virginica]